eukprot:CAMPEP_0196809744 /NCGR_PEP_ID=MMETSP1362-20130617/9630_1 /TAXON_ID=163516 /ORGANISM="Leptocylindrus danicus, Strain CCMP1856" /LENGTH=222 /DNA_ID=CAMNT_0042184511 /DNA_START=42 /DNA_END=710 /DNA_ORIENTATION=-
MSEPTSTNNSAKTKPGKKEFVRKRKNKAKQPKPKMTKEERRAKYTQKFHDRQKAKRNRNMTCFKCRKTGHMAADCPDDSGGSKSANICYKCGSTEHRLFDCKKYKGKAGEDLPFATCFVCKQMGHLSSQCKMNDNGMYPNGGCCKICGGKDHLSSKCPENETVEPAREDEEDVREETAGTVDASEYVNDGAGAGDDQPIVNEDDDIEKGDRRKKKKKKVVKF